MLPMIDDRRFDFDGAFEFLQRAFERWFVKIIRFHTLCHGGCVGDVCGVDRHMHGECEGEIDEAEGGLCTLHAGLRHTVLYICMHVCHHHDV